MKIVICDDDGTFTNLIKKEILSYFKNCRYSTPEISCFDNAEKMLLEKSSYDLAFLDVEMSGISGIVAAKQLKKFNKNILIFIVTSHESYYLDDAMEEGVYRYVTKPINPVQLHININSALQRIKSFSKNIVIETPEGIISIDSDDIVMIYTEGRKIFVETTTNTFRTYHPFQYWENTLPDFSFAKSYKGIIIHLKYVKRITDDTVMLTINDETAYLSVRNRSVFKRRFMDYMNAVN